MTQTSPVGFLNPALWAVPDPITPPKRRKWKPILIGAVTTVVVTITGAGVFWQHSLITDTRAELAATRAELVDTSDTLKDKSADLASATSELSAARNTIASQKVQIDDQKTCISGLLNMSQAMLHDEWATAVSEIEAAKPFCTDSFTNTTDTVSSA